MQSSLFNFVLSTKHKVMKTKKTTKAIYWITTVIIFLFEGVMPALTSQTQLAKEGIRHLGYPEYFGNTFVIFKVLGTLALIIPQVPNRIKEWAYAGFAFDFIFAGISNWAVDGLSFLAFFPLIFLAILITSYTFREKLKRAQSSNRSIFESNRYVVPGLS